MRGETGKPGAGARPSDPVVGPKGCLALKGRSQVDRGVDGPCPPHTGSSCLEAPGAAMAAGADHIVVGRPIRDAADPRAAAEAIQAEIADALAATSTGVAS